MNLEKILNTQTVRLVTFSPRGGGLVHAGRASRVIGERYDFMQGPHSLQDYDLEKGISFLHGYSSDDFVIDRLSIYSRGVLVESKVNSTLVTRFIDEFIGVVEEAINVTAEFPQKLTIHKSILEINMQADIRSQFESLSRLSKLIEKSAISYGFEHVVYGATGFTLGPDSASTQAMRPGVFRLERREGVPWSSETYYSEAPLTTDDHIGLLNEIEALIGRPRQPPRPAA